MTTRIMIFNISKKFDEWVAHSGSHREIQAAVGITPLFSGSHEYEPVEGLYCYANRR